MATASAVRTAEREEARSFLRSAEASVLEARGFSAAVSRELESKVGELHAVKGELKAAKKVSHLELRLLPGASALTRSFGSYPELRLLP